MRNLFGLVVVLLAMGAAATARAAVSFELAGDRLTTQPAGVFVAGSFNGWSTTATKMVCDGTVWRAEVALADGRQFYKFVWRDAAGQNHSINDPTNPRLSDDGANGANNFADVLDGERVAGFAGLEKFEWRAADAQWVCVAGDFNKWYLGQFHLVRQPDGLWRAYLPIRRPFAYKFIIDGLWKVEPDARAPRVPNGFGEFNSFRPATDTKLTSTVTIARAVAAGDTRELDVVTSYAASADYRWAVALVRKVAEVNAAASGTTSPLVLRALDAEAQIHKRWNRLDDAAACWKRLSESNADNPETYRAINELAAYYLYVKPDKVAALRLNEIATARAPNNVELFRAVVHYINLSLREGRVEDAVAAADAVLPNLREPTVGEDAYRGELSELWFVKGAAHNRLKQIEKAHEAFQKAITVSPSPDAQTAQRARHWLETHGFTDTTRPR